MRGDVGTLYDKIQINEATIDNYPTIQNMARFYVYDLSKSCGFISKEWALPEDGLYECFDFKKYFTEPDHEAFLVRVDGELAGFVLLDKAVTSKENDWNIGEFFVFGKFQGKGIGQIIAKQIWNSHQGKWEVSVIPENIPAYKFWKNLISDYTGGNYKEGLKTIEYDKDQPQRCVFEFASKESKI